MLSNVVSQCWIFVLEKINDRPDGLKVSCLHSQNPGRIFRKFVRFFCSNFKDLGQTFPREKSQNHFDSQISLLGRNLKRVQKPFQISRRRIGSIELGKGRGDEKYFGGQGIRILAEPKVVFIHRRDAENAEKN